MLIDEVLSLAAQLHDVADVQAFCGSIADRKLAELGARLQRDLHEDLVAFLVWTMYELAARFEPGRCSSFSKYAHGILRLRVADWFRRQFWDERSPTPRPVLLSLDGPAPADESDDEGDVALADALAVARDAFEEAAELRVALGQLAPTSRRTLVELLSVDGNVAAAARAAAVPDRAGGRQAYAARARALRTELKQLGIAPR